MEQDKIKKLKGQFIGLMYEKGYRRKFFLNQGGKQLMTRPYELPVCLEQIIKATQENQAIFNRFDLDTTTTDGIRCTFRVSFNEERGFFLHEMTVNGDRPNGEKIFRLNNSHRFPGASVVDSSFTQPKPWNHITKGKFRL